MIALDIVSQITQIIGALAVLAAAYTYVVHRKQLNFDVMTKCTERFRSIVSDLSSQDQDKRQRAQREYVDLCNEQLFYFGANYLPDAVVNEWLDGMIDYLPQTKSRPESNVPPEVHCENFSCKKPIPPEILEGYSRTSNAFYAGEGRPYNLNCSEQRAQYIERIKGQLQREEDMLEALADTLKLMERRIYFYIKDRTR